MCKRPAQRPNQSHSDGTMRKAGAKVLIFSEMASKSLRYSCSFYDYLTK